MIDWLTVIIALVIITSLVGGFGFLAWKINMSDLLNGTDSNQLLDSVNDKKKKDKTANDQGKKKRKDQKKSKRDIKYEENQQTKTKETSLHTSEETDDERNDSEQDLLEGSKQNVDLSSKARKRNKNKAQTLEVSATTTKINEKTTTAATRAPPVTHPKSTSKDDFESTKQHNKSQAKSSSVVNQPTLANNTTTITTNKKSKQQQQQYDNDHESFTIVGSNRSKTSTPSTSQQQNKPSGNATSTSTPTPSIQNQHEPLAQRQQVSSHKQIPLQVNGHINNSLPTKQQTTSTPALKIADLIKTLPSNQIVVAELMCALDATSLSADELDIIMHKIANKQSILKPDWSKLQHSTKSNAQLANGQGLVESTRAHDDDSKNKSLQRLKELTDELNVEKRRYQDLLKEKTDKEREIQRLNGQLNTVENKNELPKVNSQLQNKIETLETQLKRLTEDYSQLTQKQLLATATTGDSSNVQVHVLSEQIKKLSVDNANWEKKANTNESLLKQVEKEKEELICERDRIMQKLEHSEKEFKHYKQLTDTQALQLNEINQYKTRIEQLENENEQLRREDIIHVEPSVSLNNEEREQYEKQIHDYKTKVDELQTHEHQLRQEIEHLKQDKNNAMREMNESYQKELNTKENQLKTLTNELDEMKLRKSQTDESFHQECVRQRQSFVNLLSEDLRQQLSTDNQDFDQWFASYRQLFESMIESNKKTFQDETIVLKTENAKLLKNMNEIENQLKDIEKAVQCKEETLLNELKHKDSSIENIRHENNRLNNELEHLKTEIHRLQSAHDASLCEARALKNQLDERFLVAANSPSIVADESFELVKQPSPSLSPIVVDIRAEQLNELIRSSKEALENQDSLAQQLDKHLNEFRQNSTGETTLNVDESTVSSSTNHQS